MSDDFDPFLELAERFAARGVNLKTGNFTQDMVKHLLDVVEEQDVRIRGLEDAVRKLRGVQAITQPEGGDGVPPIGKITPDGD